MARKRLSFWERWQIFITANITKLKITWNGNFTDGNKIEIIRRRKMLEKFVKDHYQKSLKDCSNEEIYIALLELVKEQAKQR